VVTILVNQVGATRERVPRVGPKRKPSRDRTRDQKRFTHARECPPTMKGIPGREHCLLFTERRKERPLATPIEGIARKRGAREMGATGVSEVRPNRECRRNKPCVNLKRPAEADRAS